MYEYIRPTAHNAIHCQFDISTNAIEIRVLLQSVQSDVLLTVHEVETA
jgi:hypothetical protein